MNETRINWTIEDSQTGVHVLNIWGNATPGAQKWVYEERGAIARALIVVQAAADQLAFVARMRKELGAGNLEALMGLLTNADKLTDIGTRAEIADDAGVGPQYRMARAAMTDVYRHAMAPPKSYQGMQVFGHTEAQLGWPLAAYIALTIVGVAATAATAWWKTETDKEKAKAWMAVEAEKAWALHRAWSEIEINKAAIAAGKDPVLADWGSTRSRIAKYEQSPITWAAVGVVGGAAAVLGGMALQRRRPTLPTKQNPKGRAG